MSAAERAWFPLPVDAATTTLDLGALLGRTAATDGFLYLDCGAWMGDGKSTPVQRGFALVCGRTAVLCEYRGERPVELLQGGPPDETGPLNRLLTTLAGPMRLDVTVRRALRSPSAAPLPDRPAGADRTVYLLLPDLHLPLVTRMPDLDPNLVPDPRLATCACHGPVITRMLYGTPTAPARYRAVGAALSRNPNDWFYLMAESHRPAAADLGKLLDRLARHSPSSPVHLLQLGGLCEVWTGFDCVFQSTGRVAFIRPQIVGDVREEELAGRWRDLLMTTRSRDVVERLVRLPASRRTLLRAPRHHGELAPDDAGASFEAPGVLFAENRPARMDGCDDEAPTAFLALREQQARFQSWRRTMAPGWRLSVLSQVVARYRARGFPIYAMAHSHEPCLLAVGAD